MMTYAEWLTRWARRWVDDAHAEIERHNKLIGDLNASLTTADEDEEECLRNLIDHHQSIIDSIIVSHRQWQRFAKRRWKLDVPEV